MKEGNTYGKSPWSTKLTVNRTKNIEDRTSSLELQPLPLVKHRAWDSTCQVSQIYGTFNFLDPFDLQNVCEFNSGFSFCRKFRYNSIFKYLSGIFIGGTPCVASLLRTISMSSGSISSFYSSLYRNGKAF